MATVKSFIKTWWHCLWKCSGDHRMMSIQYDGRTSHFCSCSQRGRYWSDMINER